MIERFPEFNVVERYAAHRDDLDPSLKIMKDEKTKSMETSSAEYALLQSNIGALKDAATRTRGSWLVSLALSLMLLVPIYNVRVTENRRQLETRAKLLREIADFNGMKPVATPNYLVGVYDPKLIERYKDTQIEDKYQDLVSGISGNGYFRWMQSLLQVPGRSDSEHSLAMGMLRVDAEERLKRQISFDLVEVPVINIKFVTSDAGKIGGFAILIMGYWMLACLRRQKQCFESFVKLDGNLVQPQYSRNELRFSYEFVRHSFVLLVRKTEGVVMFSLGTVSFLVPLATIVAINAVDVYTMWALWPHVQGVTGPRLFQWALLLLNLVCWARCMVLQSNMCLMFAGWHDLIAGPATSPPVRFLRSCFNSLLQDPIQEFRLHRNGIKLGAYPEDKVPTAPIASKSDSAGTGEFLG